MWIRRDLGERIRQIASQSPCLLLTGARQVGKTELLKHYFPKHSFVNLDLPSTAALADRDGTSFLEQHPPPLIIDEAQYAPGLFRPLKIQVDANRDRNGQYLLSGSQRFELMREASESLAGRIAIIELETLSFREIHRHDPSIGIETVLLRGGYPELHQKPAYPHSDFYSSYVSTYLERDLRSLLKVSSLRDFERFLRACAVRSGQLVNRSELARDVGISATTANQWISLLETSNVLSLLEPWFVNASKSITKSPKLYFRDTGLLCFLLNIHSEADLLQSPLLGNIWETYVYAELRKLKTAKYGSHSLYFYRDRNKEIDFLVPQGNQFHLYEVKWSRTPDKDSTKRLKEFEALVGQGKILSSTIICRTDSVFPVDPSTMATNLVSLRDFM